MRRRRSACAGRGTTERAPAAPRGRASSSGGRGAPAAGRSAGSSEFSTKDLTVSELETNLLSRLQRLERYLMSATTAAAAIRTAFLGRDFAPLEDRLGDAVVFRSPVLAQPWTTRRVLAELGPAMVSIFDEVFFDR